MAASDASEGGHESVGGLSAEIITTGTEILLGEIVDTNAAWIAQQLRDIGVNLYYKTTIGDNFGRIVATVEQALARSNVVIISGGLGPTADDVTRHAIAAATARELAAHPQALEALKARFTRMGTQMTSNNLQQVLIPAEAILIENPVGTAPGFIVESVHEGHVSAVIALPGVPREMKHLMTETVIPYLRKRAGNVGVITRRVLRTIGIGESTIDDRLGELMLGRNPTVGLAAHAAQADVRITARGADAAEADRLLDVLEADIRRRIGDHIYSLTPGESIEAVVAATLHKQQANLALVETNTAGALAARLTAAGGDTTVAQAWRGDAPAQTSAALQAAVDAALGGGEAAIISALEAARLAAMSAGAAIGVAIIGSADAADGVYGHGTGQTAIAVYRTPQKSAVAAQREYADVGERLTAGPEASAPKEVEPESGTLLLPYGGADEFSVIRIGNQALHLLWNLLK